MRFRQSWPQVREVDTVFETPRPRRSRALQRRDEIRKQVVITILRRQGLTLNEAEEQYEMGRR